jgi:glutathione S-transferase
MIKLVIGNRTYSSWSLRGWLAVKRSGLDFEEQVVPMFDAQWPERRKDPLINLSGGKVPVLADGEHVIWDSLAIVEWLAERTDPALFWPADDGARAMARSMCAEMHSGFANLRRIYGMNLRKRFPPEDVREEARDEIARIADLWTEARARHGDGGPYLFGAFGAADIMYAPVATRFETYSIRLAGSAAAYRDVILDHPWMREWIAAAKAEPWVIEHYEAPGA